MASSIAHEINNPMMIIQNLISLLIEDVNLGLNAIPIGPDSEHYEGLRIILNQCDRVSNVIHNLTDFSRTNTNKAKKHDVAWHIQETINIMNKEFVKNNIEIEVKIKTEKHHIRIKKDLITQILINLLKNSLEAIIIKRNTPEHKNQIDKITITLREKIQEKTEKIFLIVDLMDNGVGVKPENHGRIGTPFFTTKKDKAEKTKNLHLGLGLALSENSLENIGGHITFDSEFGKYTCFHIYLPAFDEATEKEENEIVF